MMRAQIEEDLIYDVGMHEGDDSEFYLKKGFRVVGIEALPSLAKTASERLRTYIESGQLVILNVAVAEKEGPLPFFESLHCSLWGTINPERGKTNDREGYRFVRRTVKGSNFASILKEYGIPYYLKIDIEGAETLCLKALKSFTSRPKFISYEALPASSSVMREEFAFLRTLGYSRFKAVRQDTVDAQRCPFPAREGQYVDHRFGGSASGLFGEEAPGDWMDEAGAAKFYDSLRARHNLINILNHLRLRRLLRSMVPDPGWYDLHAKLD